MPTIKILRPGAPKSNPFTICIIANPALESPRDSGIFAPDPILNKQAVFDAAVSYIDTCLFGALPGQAEQLLSDPSISSEVRVVSIFDSSLAPSAANSLVALDSSSFILVARRKAFRPLLTGYGLDADVAYAVSLADSHTRASAWFTTDDDTQAGVPFTLDGAPYFHRFYSQIPGTVAIHATATSLTALHEFQHAISSYTNGSLVDLYIDNFPGVNCKVARPIPPGFGTYNASILNSDISRDHLSYPPGWRSYHCELLDPQFPAVMDNYWLSSGPPEVCKNDAITRQFLLDRLKAKIARP